MKKTTCKGMNGVCDAEIRGETPEEMMSNGQQHVRNEGDDDHKNFYERMMHLSKEDHDKMVEDFTAKFDSLEEVEN